MNQSRVSAATPFGRGSVSLRLYPHNELPPAEIIGELSAQGCLALDRGFDGIMTSEHHGGFAGYMAQPLQMATFILEDSAAGWVAASPLLLPLRPTALVAEEVAWLNARHPGRVGLGVAAGALPLDFQIARLNQSDAIRTFKDDLPWLVSMLQGRELGELAGDPALEACARNPVPVVSAAVSVAAAKRAARCGAGILMEGMSGPERVALLTEAFDAAGGIGSKVLIRRVWLGETRADLVRRQRKVYESYTDAATTFGDDQTIASSDPEEIVAGLRGLVEATNVDALNLRVHLPGIPPEAIREQIDGLGREVVPQLRDLWTTS